MSKSITDITDERNELLRLFRLVRDQDELMAFEAFTQLIRYVSDDVREKHGKNSPYVNDLWQLAEHLLVTHFGGQMEEIDG